MPAWLADYLPTAAGASSTGTLVGSPSTGIAQPPARSPDQRSALDATNLVALVLDAAHATGARHFLSTPKYDVFDDHIPLQDAGIPAVDLIDFDYKHWHCVSDLPENCSGENMEQVARVLSVWLQRVK